MWTPLGPTVGRGRMWTPLGPSVVASKPDATVAGIDGQIRATEGIHKKLLVILHSSYGNPTRPDYIPHFSVALVITVTLNDLEILYSSSIAEHLADLSSCTLSI
jgi:hypothetical protein